MSTLIPAMVATAILGIVTIPIVNLSLETVKSRVNSELFSEAETLALGIRREAAQANTIAVSGGELILDGANVPLPAGCSVTSTSVSGASVLNSVTCTSSRGNREQRNSQPLFSASDFISDDGSIVCYSRYQSQNASDRGLAQYTKVTSIDDFNEIISRPGNSGGFVQLHTLNFPDCALAAQIQPSAPNESDAPETNCPVPNFIGSNFNPSSGSRTWNDNGGEISASWSGNRKVKGQTPAAGSSAPCSSILSLSR